MNTEIGTTKDISIHDLLLDSENYRLGPQAGQNETIQAMIAEQGAKLVVLAEDIATNGLSPFDLLMVCPTDTPGKYRVIEGNRRITCLKLLNQPALAHGTPIEKGIREISGDKKSKLIDQCRCVIVESKEQAYLWIERKHDTGLEGAGTESWLAVAIRRAKAAMGKPQIALQVIDFVTKNAPISDDEKKKITAPKYPITNLERILEDKDSLAQLGLHVENEEIVATKSPDWVLSMLTQIVTDLGSKAKKVGDIFDKKKRDKYISDVSSQQKTTAGTAKPWSLVSGTTLKGVGAAAGASKGKRLPLSTDRKTLIPRGYKLAIPHARLNKIYDELRKLKVDDLENAAAVLFRVFVELSADHYIHKKGVAAKPDDKLRVKLQKITDFMEQNSIMTKNDLKPIRKALSNQNEVLSTDTLNAYVHNLHVIPKAKDLKTSWDSLEPFVANLWK